MGYSKVREKKQADNNNKKNKNKSIYFYHKKRLSDKTYNSKQVHYHMNQKHELYTILKLGMSFLWNRHNIHLYIIGICLAKCDA